MMMTNDSKVLDYQRSRHEMRALVDLYDSIQNLRKGADNKRRSHEQGYDREATMEVAPDLDDDGQVEGLEEPAFLAGVRDQLGGIEESVAKYLEGKARESLLGRWCLSIDGIGGVLAAGLLAFIDFHRCCCNPYRELKGKKRDAIPVHECPGLATAGAVYSFAGMLDREQQPWLPGTRRPYNVRLKTHMWKIADQFRRQSVNAGKLALPEDEMMAALRAEDPKKYANLDDEDLRDIVQAKKSRMMKKQAKLDSRLYATLYMQRKERDQRYNEEGRFKDKAAKMLAMVSKRKVKISPAQKKCWESGRLQPCGIDLRAMRYAAKIFLSHFHQVGREIYFGDYVEPWVFAHGGEQHVHYIPVPNLDMVRTELNKQKRA